MRLPDWARQHLAALRALLILTAVCGVVYPLLVTAVVQLPGLRSKADGSLIEAGGRTVGSKIIGQGYLDRDGNPLKQYFQSRPSAAGAGYDPTSTSASNLGPEDIVDVLPDPASTEDTGRQSLLTQVCTRSKHIGELDGVDGSRPFCTPSGVGAVLAVFRPRGADGRVTTPKRVVAVNEACPAAPFLATYRGVTVQCGRFGEDYAAGETVPVRGDAPAQPKVPAEAVTASGSGLDPDISPAYARIQAARVAQARGITVEQVQQLIADRTR